MSFDFQKAHEAYVRRDFEKLMLLCNHLTEMRLDASALLWLTRLNTGMSNQMIHNACMHIENNRLSFNRDYAINLLSCNFSDDTAIEQNIWFEGLNELKRCYIQSGTRFGLFSYVAHGSFVGTGTSMGRYCSIGMNSTVGPGEHTIDWLGTHNFLLNQKNVDRENQSRYANQRLEIGNDVWIGANVCVKTNVKIGHGSVIGAGTVVVKDVEPYSIVVGNPGRVLRMRFSDDVVERLLKSEWWRLPFDYVKQIPFHDVEKSLDVVDEFRSLLPESALI